MTLIQRQIVLAKLLHEFETVPDFGEDHISDFRAPQLQWITRVSALMNRAGFKPGFYFDSASKKMHLQYNWTTGVREALMEVSKTIEAIKLDLELDGESEIGKVYEANRSYDFFVDLKSILDSSKSEIFVVDPYFNGKAFDNLLVSIRPPVKIRILSRGPLADEVKPYAVKHAQQYSSEIFIKKTKKTHDRVIFIDNLDGWIIGGSLNDGGNKLSYILPIHPALTPQKNKIYEDIWQNATVVV